MATTTLAAIKNQWNTLFEALTPASESSIKFRRGPLDVNDFRQWATEYPTAASRRYQVRRVQEVTENPWHHPQEHWVTEPVLIEIAYHPQAFRGTGSLDDTEDIIRADARQIADTVYNSDNYITGQDGPTVTIGDLVRDEDQVWFQEILVDVRYKETRQ